MRLTADHRGWEQSPRVSLLCGDVLSTVLTRRCEWTVCKLSQQMSLPRPRNFFPARNHALAKMTTATLDDGRRGAPSIRRGLRHQEVAACRRFERRSGEGRLDLAEEHVSGSMTQLITKEEAICVFVRRLERTTIKNVCWDIGMDEESNDICKRAFIIGRARANDDCDDLVRVRWWPRRDQQDR